MAPRVYCRTHPSLALNSASACLDDNSAHPSEMSMVQAEKFLSCFRLSLWGRVESCIVLIRQASSICSGGSVSYRSCILEASGLLQYTPRESINDSLLIDISLLWPEGGLTAGATACCCCSCWTQLLHECTRQPVRETLPEPRHVHSGRPATEYQIDSDNSSQSPQGFHWHVERPSCRSVLLLYLQPVN